MRFRQGRHVCAECDTECQCQCTHFKHLVVAGRKGIVSSVHTAETLAPNENPADATLIAQVDLSVSFC